VCLRLAFVLVTRVAAWLRLSRREEAWKTAEILMLRHQLAILQPRRPKLNWADRALLAPARRDANCAAPRAPAAGHPGHARSTRFSPMPGSAPSSATSRRTA
jgi:hypothetical protein